MNNRQNAKTEISNTAAISKMDTQSSYTIQSEPQLVKCCHIHRIVEKFGEGFNLDILVMLD